MRRLVFARTELLSTGRSRGSFLPLVSFFGRRRAFPPLRPVRATIVSEGGGPTSMLSLNRSPRRDHSPLSNPDVEYLEALKRVCA